MRRSFGQGTGGGGGGRGGGMIKTVHRVIGGGGGGGGAPPEPYSYTTTRTTANSRNNQPINTNLFLSNNTNPTSPCAHIHHPVPPAAPPSWDFSPAAGEEFDWEYIDGGGSDCESVYGQAGYEDLLYGSVPSKDEVYHAVSSLQEVFEPVSFAQLIKDQKTYGSDDDGVERILNPTSFHKSGSELDWTEPSLQLWNSTSSMLVPSRGKLYDAFHLLQTEPSVQRMVISLSSDKAVWDAVMNNEVVCELRESIEDKSISGGLEDSDDNDNPVTHVLRWIFVNTKEKVIEIVEKITKIVNELVQPMNKGENSKKDVNVELNSFEEKLRSSFFLSIMVLLIVVVSRSRKC